MSEFHTCLDDSKFVYDIGYVLCYDSFTVILQPNLTRSAKCKIHYKSVLSSVCHCPLSLVNDFVTAVLNGPVVVTFYVSADIQSS